MLLLAYGLFTIPLHKISLIFLILHKRLHLWVDKKLTRPAVRSSAGRERSQQPGGHRRLCHRWKLSQARVKTTIRAAVSYEYPKIPKCNIMNASKMVYVVEFTDGLVVGFQAFSAIAWVNMRLKRQLCTDFMKKRVLFPESGARLLHILAMVWYGMVWYPWCWQSRWWPEPGCCISWRWPSAW